MIFALTIFSLSETNTLRRNFYELNPYGKLGPRCWWVQSWIPPTSRPEFLLVFAVYVYGNNSSADLVHKRDRDTRLKLLECGIVE